MPNSVRRLLLAAGLCTLALAGPLAAHAEDQPQVSIEQACGLDKLDGVTDMAVLEKAMACARDLAEKQMQSLQKELKSLQPAGAADDPCQVPMFTSGPTGLGGRLLEAVRRGELDEAYGYLAPEMQAKVSRQDLPDYLDKLLWPGHRLAGRDSLGVMTLGGATRCENRQLVWLDQSEVRFGTDYAAMAVFAYTGNEEATARIHSIEAFAGNPPVDPASLAVPEAGRLRDMVAETLHVFVVATLAGKMDDLWTHGGLMLRQRVTGAELDRRFARYFQKLSFESLNNQKIAVTAVSATPVIVAGHPTIEVTGTEATNKLGFTMSFAYDGSWDLADLQVGDLP